MQFSGNNVLLFGWRDATPTIITMLVAVVFLRRSERIILIKNSLSHFLANYILSENILKEIQSHFQIIKNRTYVKSHCKLVRNLINNENIFTMILNRS